MITHVQVSGYKTLDKFSLSLRPGLNILVGPNGSGKTNVVSFFEFLALLVDKDAAEAVSGMGGAGSVFRRVDETYLTQISATIRGCYSIEESASHPALHAKTSREKGDFACYEYSFSIRFSKDVETVFIGEQRFRYARSFEFQSAHGQNDEGWPIDIVATMDRDFTVGVRVEAFDNIVAQFPFFPERDPVESRNTKFQEFLTSVLGPSTSLLSGLGRFGYSAFSAILNDISGAKTYNIVPSKVKIPEDSAKSPGIDRDGSGLTATLWALKRRRDMLSPQENWFTPYRARFNIEHVTLDTLLSYLVLANHSITSIDIINDSFDNLLRVTFTIESDDYRARVPLAFMSDGTLKWLALITAALTTTSVFSVEEPENYLHPQMQAEVVNVLRELLTTTKKYACIVMTTHSETLLNHCKPEELIVVSLRSGRTVAKICSNERELSSEIARTGFGLGYYYMAGALIDE